MQRDNRLRSKDFFEGYFSPKRILGAQKQALFQAEIEITSKCAGSCVYCFDDSSDANSTFIPTERLKKLIDELEAVGIKQITLAGGDPLLHPGIFEILDYLGDKGLNKVVFTSGILSRTLAKKLCKQGLHLLGINIPSRNQDVYNKLHRNPKTMEMRIKGYYYLLELGFPPDRILPAILLSSASVETVEETIDWFVDEMGAVFIPFCMFKPHGFGQTQEHLEPSLSQVKRAFYYRAKKLGNFWLKLGPTECGRNVCQTRVFIGSEGQVTPCGSLPDHFVVGNIYQESFRDIISKKENLDKITFNFEIKGYCQTCEHKEFCRGCRSNAYYYLDDVRESDPKCWFNPRAKELYRSQDI